MGGRCDGSLIGLPESRRTTGQPRHCTHPRPPNPAAARGTSPLGDTAVFQMNEEHHEVSIEAYTKEGEWAVRSWTVFVVFVLVRVYSTPV